MFTQEIAYSTAYLAGVASFFSPCIFPIIPVYISILSNGEKKSLSKTLAFVLGLSVTYIILGFGAGVIGDLFLDDKVRIIGGIIVMILGLFQMEILKLKFLEKTKPDNWTVNKAIQKIRESLKVTKAEKEKILVLKRK